MYRDIFFDSAIACLIFNFFSRHMKSNNFLWRVKKSDEQTSATHFAK